MKPRAYGIEWAKPELVASFVTPCLVRLISSWVHGMSSSSTGWNLQWASTSSPHRTLCRRENRATDEDRRRTVSSLNLTCNDPKRSECTHFGDGLDLGASLISGSRPGTLSDFPFWPSREVASALTTLPLATSCSINFTDSHLCEIKSNFKVLVVNISLFTVWTCPENAPSGSHHPVSFCVSLSSVTRNLHSEINQGRHSSDWGPEALLWVSAGI